MADSNNTESPFKDFNAGNFARHYMSFEQLRDLPFLPLDAAIKGTLNVGKNILMAGYKHPKSLMKGTSAFAGRIGGLGISMTRAASFDVMRMGKITSGLLTGSFGFRGQWNNPSSWARWNTQLNGGLFPNFRVPGVSDPLQKIAINPRVGRRIVNMAAGLGALQGAVQVGNDAPAPSVFVDADGMVHSKNDMGANGNWAMSMRRRR